MKKFIVALSVLYMAIVLAACGLTGSTASLTDKGLGLILEVDKLAECKEYIGLFSSSPEIASIVEGVADKDYDEPTAVFVIENLDSMVFENMLSDTKLPSDIGAIVKGRFANALPSQINAMNGAMTLAATSILNHSGSFIHKGLADSATYLYTYDNGYSFMVPFTPGDENIVNASVTVVVNEELSKCSTQEQVVSFFADTLGFEDVKVS